MSLDGNTFPNNEAYLKDYEEKIRQLPYEELNDILDVIDRNPVSRDKSPERINIVKKRMAELEPIVCQEEERKAKLHEELEERYRKNHSHIFSIILFLPMLIAVQFFEFNDNVKLIFTGLILPLFALDGFINKGFISRGGTIHKDETPILFKIYLITFLIASVICLVSGIYYSFNP